MPRKKKEPVVIEAPTPVENLDEPKQGIIDDGDTTPEETPSTPSAARARLTGEAARILNSLSITPEEMARETTDELILQRMALVGCLQNIHKICEVVTMNVLNSPGALNIHNIVAMLAGLKNTISLAEKSLIGYTQTQAALRARDAIVAIQKKFREEQETEARNKAYDEETFSKEPTKAELDQEDDDAFDLMNPEDETRFKKATGMFMVRKGRKGNLLN